MAKEQRTFAQLPLPKSGNNGKQYDSEYVQFMGFNQRQDAGQGELAGMTNMCSDNFPVISPRKSRSNSVTMLTPNGLNASEKLSWVNGTDYSYNSTIRGQVTSGKKNMVAYKDRVYIFPDKKYYDSITSTFASMVGYIDIQRGFYATYTADYAPIVGDGEYYPSDNYACSQYMIAVKDSVTYTITNDGGYTGTVLLVCYDEKMRHSGYKTTFWGNTFTNEIAITGIKVSYVNIVWEKKTTEPVPNTKTKVSITNLSYPAVGSVPTLTQCVTLSNRMVGINSADSMVYISSIINETIANSEVIFTQFLLGSGGSCALEVNTVGKFTGIVNFQGTVIIFKENSMYKLFGSNASNFTVAKIFDIGTKYNESIVEVNGVLFFLANDGIYAYTGGKPQLVSEKLNRTFTSGVAGTDGRKYYISAYDGSSYGLYVFDTMYNVWHVEDSLNVVEFARYGDKLHALASTGYLYKFNDGNETISWSMTTKKITGKIPNKKISCEIDLRLDVNSGANVDVYISINSGNFALQKSITTTGTFKTYRVPLKVQRADSFQVRLSGTGNVLIHEMHIRYRVGSVV
jgi:hypothetical protein